MKKSLTKKEILRKQSDLKRIFASGKSFKCRGAKILFLPNFLIYNRFAVTLVRKYGNSVERNYSKRILREIYRTQKELISAPYDVVIVLYPGDYSFQDRYEQFNKLLRRANLV
ncbi:MAG: ribonuclease P protein component [Spirochaetaceae bacterium 4572_59]|nr:MAG: ribonuclease P protein component [Spirochaetaceae bacterium 4572_59]